MSNKGNNNMEEAILKAAEAEFVEHGFDGARTTSIAEKAGVTHAMLHYYFRTKEQLFDRILEEKFSTLAESVLLIFSTKGMTLKERLEKGIATHFDFVAQNPNLPRFLMSELPRVSPVVRATFLPKLSAVISEVQKELDMDVRMLMLDIVSQNLFPFLVTPLLETLTASEDRNAMLEQIKQENITLILKRLDL